MPTVLPKETSCDKLDRSLPMNTDRSCWESNLQKLNNILIDINRNYKVLLFKRGRRPNNCTYYSVTFGTVEITTNSAIFRNKDAIQPFAVVSGLLLDWDRYGDTWFVRRYI